MGMPPFDAAQIRRYYDRQTAGFVALGQGGSGGFIHRAVWGPGVRTSEAAFHFVEDRIAELLHDLASLAGGDTPHIVDLGCGVGGSLAYLAMRLPIRGTGVTLSPVQVRLATERIHSLGLADRVTCLEADYTQLPLSVEPADLAFAIESFVHGPSPVAFFEAAARLVRPDGLLVVCDDFRRAEAGDRAKRAIDQFRRGWHVNTLLPRDEVVALAAAAGFTCEAATDLTPWLELGRPRDRAVAAFVALFGWLALEQTRIGHLVGGTALQTCLTRGWIGYELVVFRRARHRRLKIEDW
jgi:cyclopropane fatty-acyl-phospholipid synthase-like methyltransferase